MWNHGEGTRNSSSFAVASQTTEVMATVHYRWLIKMGKALNFTIRYFERERPYAHNFYCSEWMWKSLSHGQLFATPWTYIVHGILQARILEGVAFPFSRESSQLRDRSQVPRIAGRFFTSWAPRGSPLLQYTVKIAVFYYQLLFISYCKLSAYFANLTLSQVCAQGKRASVRFRTVCSFGCPPGLGTSPACKEGLL